MSLNYSTNHIPDSRRRIVCGRDQVAGVEELDGIVSSTVGDALGSDAVKEWNCHGGEDYEL